MTRRLPLANRSAPATLFARSSCAPRRMVYAVAPAARSSALEAAELRDEARVIEQFDLAGVQQREHVAIDVALRMLREIVRNAVHAEALARPLAGVPVAGDAMHAIALKRLGEVGDDALRGERRSALADAVEDRAPRGLIAVRDGERHAVGRAAAGIDEGDVARAGYRRELASVGEYRCVDDLATDEVLDVGAEDRQILGAGCGRIGLHRAVDDPLRQGSGSWVLEAAWATMISGSPSAPKWRFQVVYASPRRA